MVIAIAATKYDVIKYRPPTDTMEEGTDMKQMPLPSVPQHQEPAIPIHEAENLARTLGHIYVNTSAKENEGVTELFQRVAERVLRFRKQSEMGAQVPIPVTPGAIATGLRTPISNKTHSSTMNLFSAGTSGAAISGTGSSVSGFGDRHDFDYGLNANSSSHHTASEASEFRLSDIYATSRPAGYDTYHFDAIPGGEDDVYDKDFHQSMPDSAPSPRGHERKISNGSFGGGRKEKKSLAICSDGALMCDLFSSSTEDNDSIRRTSNSNADGVVSCSVS